MSCAPPTMPHRWAAPHRACWTDLADVNLGNTVWPPADERCAYRHATLRRAQLACERTPLCVGVGRDNGLPCMAAGGIGTAPLRFELRGAPGRERWPGMKAWLLSRNGSMSGGVRCVETSVAQPRPAGAPESLLSAPERDSSSSQPRQISRSGRARRTQRAYFRHR